MTTTYTIEWISADCQSAMDMSTSHDTITSPIETAIGIAAEHSRSRQVTRRINPVLLSYLQGQTSTPDTITRPIAR